MLSRRAQIRNFIEKILSEGITEMEERSDMDWDSIKSMAQEAKDLGLILCDFKEKEYILGPEKIINITVTMKGENFVKK